MLTGNFLLVCLKKFSSTKENGGKNTFACTAALKRDSVERVAEEPVHASNEAHRRKENQVGEAVRAAGMTFRPVENLGGWTDSL